MQRIFLSPPHMSERERALLLDAFDSNWIAPLGPHVDAFESEIAAFVDMPHARALSSGTAGLHLALVEQGVQAGDRILCSTFTFAATANAIRYVGAIPVFVDSCEDDWCMDLELTRQALREQRAGGHTVRGILAVDLYGLMPDLAGLEELAEAEDLFLLEDAAEALGSSRSGRSAGSFGIAGVFSFNGNKIMTTSGGGMLVTRSADRAKHVQHLATQAREPVPYYQHERVGYNYRLSNLCAAIGRGQLERLPSMIAARTAVRDRYRNELCCHSAFEMMPEPTHTRQNGWLTCVTLTETAGVTPDDVQAHMAKAQIEVRHLWKPMHRQPVFADAPHVLNGLSDRLFDIGLCLPSGSSLTDDDQQRVIDALLNVPGLQGA